MIRHHPYRYLFYAGIVNGMGDRFSQVAVLTLILKLTGSGLAVGAALGVRILPYLIVTPLAGRLADRCNKKVLLITTDVLRIPFALSFLLVDSEEQLWLVFAGIIALSCGEAFYQPVRKSTIGTIVEKDRLLTVNGWEQFLLGVGLIAGSISGGVVAYWLGSSYAFVLNGVSFLLAACFLLPLKVNQQKRPPGPLPKKDSFTWDQWLIFALLLQLVGVTMDGAFNVLISVYGSELFQMGELGVGLLYGALGIGMVSSFFLSSQVKAAFLPTFIVLLIMEGALQVIASRVASFIALWVLFLLIAVCGGIAGAVMDAWIMNHVHEQAQGRVFGWVESFVNIQLGLMMLFSGLLLEVMDARTLGFYGGWIGLLGGFIFAGGYRVWKRSSEKRNDVAEADE